MSLTKLASVAANASQGRAPCSRMLREASFRPLRENLWVTWAVMADFGTLGLPGVELISHADEPDGLTLRLQLQQLPEPTLCTKCGGDTQGHGWTPKKNVMDSRAMGLRIKLDIRQQRVKCKDETCQQTAVRGLPFLHADFKMTIRLFKELQIIFRDLGRRFDSVAAEVGMSERTARSVFGAIAHRHEQRRPKWVCLGDTVWIAPTVLNQEQRFLVINVEQGALAEVTATADEEELLALLKRLGRVQKPLKVWIPANSNMRRAVRKAFRNCRIGLTQGSINNVIARAEEDIKKIEDAAAREAIRRAVLLVLEPAEIHDVYGPRGRLQHVARKELGGSLQWLATWLLDWEEEVVDRQFFRGDLQALTTVQRVERAVTLLNLMGNGYSFGVLRQRLLYALDQVWAYRPASPESKYMTYSTRMNDRLTESRGGRSVGTFGVPLKKITAALERAALEAPQTLPEDGPDDD